LRPDILLIIGTSLAVDGPTYELKNKLISAIHHNNEKVIYVNNSPSQKPFCKPLVDHILRWTAISECKTCNTWTFLMAEWSHAEASVSLLWL
jgi:NAD-dependent SIR2 family protein deacetylase